jgi:hypothetical protein
MKYISILLILFIISCDDDNLVDSLKFPPEVQITNPNNLDDVSDTVTVKAMATSNIGIKYCALWVDGKIVENSEDFEEPYQFTWNTNDFENGHHSLVVRATDIEGNSGDSEIIDIFVDNEEVRDNPENYSIFVVNSKEDELITYNFNGEKRIIGKLGIDVYNSRLAFHNNELYLINRTANQNITELYKIEINTGKAKLMYQYQNFQAFISGLTSRGSYLYILYEISSIPEGHMRRINMQNGEIEIVRNSNGDLSLFGLTTISNNLYVHSEYSDALYRYSESYGVVNNSKESYQLNYSWCMDLINDNEIIIVNREKQQSSKVFYYLLNRNTKSKNLLFEEEFVPGGIAVWKE